MKKQNFKNFGGDHIEREKISMNSSRNSSPNRNSKPESKFMLESKKKKAAAARLTPVSRPRG